MKDAFNTWLNSPLLTSDEKKELEEAMRLGEAEIENRFYGPLSFGTAGLRGIMGLGIHRMNRFTVSQATQGIANRIGQLGDEAKRRGVAIAYDCRENSETFSKTAACIFAANGIRVFLFNGIRPTPELSFAILHYGCIAGINVTASHNTKEYNGYKVYWEDGAQIPPQVAEAVASEMTSIDPLTSHIHSMPLEDALARGLVRMLGDETDELFLDHVLSMAVDRDMISAAAKDVKIIYTPFHGTGHRLIPEALSRLGFEKVCCVPEQMKIDGSFPTVASPNPENPESFALAIDYAKREHAELIIGTDPDADRLGVLVQSEEGGYVHLTGNQVGVLLLDYIIAAKRRCGSLPPQSAALRTIVTTNMVDAICKANGVALFETFTGFKFMAEKLKELGDSVSYLLAFEESYGYMMGDFVRDKDAVTASVLVSEMAAYYHAQNMTLLDALEALYETYGVYLEKTLSLVMPGADGIRKMQQTMQSLREQPLRDIGGANVLAARDFLTGERLAGGEKETMELAGSNVLYYELEDGTSFIVRPSGTEPKLKVYLLASGGTKPIVQAKLDRFEQAAGELFSE